MFRVYLIYQSNQCKMNTSTKFSNISISEKAKNRGLKHIAFLLLKRNYLISTECVTSLVSMDIMEKIEVIKLYNRTIKKNHSFLLNALIWFRQKRGESTLETEQKIYKTRFSFLDRQIYCTQKLPIELRSFISLLRQWW